MEQKYEIFINGSPLLILGPDMHPPEGAVPYTSKKELKQMVMQLENESIHPGYTIVHKDVESVFSTIKSFFHVLSAAGGIVLNNDKELLMIFRYNKWDLPKGKMEEEELPEETALREVREECGISGLELTDSSGKTYHTFKHGRKRILKETMWFKMHCSDPESISPQTEESITEIKWMRKKEIEKALKNTYPNVLRLLKGVLPEVAD